MPSSLEHAESRLVDLGVVCLVCLRAEDGYCSIYGQDLETPHMQIVDKIRSCSALQLDRLLLSQLPDKICHGCRNELSITYRFQQKCLEALQVFQSATGTTLSELDKLQLEQQQQLKLPSSLRIKRLEAEPASASIKYYNEDDDDDNEVNIDDNNEESDDNNEESDDDEGDGDDDDNGGSSGDTIALIKPDNAVTACVLQDEIEEDNKMLALDVDDWATDPIDQTQEQCELDVHNLELDHEQDVECEQKVEPDDDTIKYSYEQIYETTPCSAVNCRVNGSRRSPEPKVCDICGNTYKYQHVLNAHMRRHKNERPYPCEVCQKAFISNVELRRHMRVHTGQKPYGCRYCDRRFSDFGSSKKHERIHTGERPYVCEVCNKGFAYSHVLSVHRRTHTGKKQFQCTQCDKGFTKKSYLATHMQQLHRINPLSTPKVEPATNQRLPIRKQQQPQSQSQHPHGKQLRYVDDNDDDYDDDNNVGIVASMTPLDGQVAIEQAKVLEECIVTSDFMFHEDDADDATANEMDDYHDTQLDESSFENVRHVKVNYGLVGDLLDEDLVNDTKYLID